MSKCCPNGQCERLPENRDTICEMNAQRAEIERLSGCLLAIHRANHASASALRSVAYDAALNCITPDVAEFQCGARTIEQTGD